MKIIRIIKKVLYKVLPPHLRSYSQAGEDAVLMYLFSDFGKEKISYLDLGTNIPDYGNNTFLFYQRKSYGVCVEADSSLINGIKKKRPKDVVINAGVTFSEETKADFYIFDEPSINTFDKDEAENRLKSKKYQIVRIDKVPLVRINDLIKNNFDTYPDLISIDIEGLDLLVLKDLDFSKYPIPVICVETCLYSENHIRPKDNRIAEFLGNKGYEIYADTYINTIFINKKWFYNT